jgi:hypothetical protein
MHASKAHAGAGERHAGPGEANLPGGHLDGGSPQVSLEDLRVATVELHAPGI